MNDAAIASRPADETPHVDLEKLIRVFYPSGSLADSPLGSFEPIETAPAAFASLLDHDHHMTVTVERHWSSAVNVVVHRHQTVDGWYEREITLVTQTENRTVQYGIVRLDIHALRPEVWQRIASRKIPLGRVLIEHNVLREVQLERLWKVRCGPKLQSMLELRTDDAVVYGRTALIWCNHQPAIELLEVVRTADD